MSTAFSKFDVGVFGAAHSGEGVTGSSETGRGGSFYSTSGPQLHLEGSATVPSSPASGDFWVDANTGNLWYYHDSSGGWVQLA